MKLEYRTWIWWPSVLAAVAVSGIASGAEVDVGDADLLAGLGSDQTPVDIVVSGGDNIAAIQFDLVPAGEFIKVDVVEPGAAAEAANKDASFSTLSNGDIRIVVSGFNVDTIGSGELVEMRVRATLNAPDGDHAVNITNIIASDPDGNPVAATGTGGTFSVTVVPIPSVQGIAFIVLVLIFIVAGAVAMYSFHSRVP